MCFAKRIMTRYSIILVTIILIKSVKDGNILVAITDGLLQGAVKTDYDNGKFYSFTKIPYGEPPIEEYRFKVPEVKKPWTNTLDATLPSPLCIQPSADLTGVIGQEDCLYLNVYTKSINKLALKPVMVYIHGGLSIRGNSAEFGPEFLMTEDIVLVTINYRLGINGYINTINSDIAPINEMFGNNAFKDQILAFKWVQKNILYFGGDPLRVTICGDSSGGMSVHSHMLSPLSKGLFQQVIAISGSALMPAQQSATNTATQIANYLNLNTTHYDTMMQALRNTSNEAFFQAALALKWFDTQIAQEAFTGIAIEKPGVNSFISDYPLNIIKSGNYNKVPLFIGNTNREGLFAYALKFLQTNLQELKNHIPFYLKGKEEIMRKIRQVYNLNSINSTLDEIDFYTNIWIKYHLFRTAREHVRTANQPDVYYYEFSGDGKLNHLKPYFDSTKNLPGACHGDDLSYLFKIRGVPTPGSIEEKLMRYMVKTWTNFVTTGVPTNNLKPFRQNDYNFVNISNNGLEIGILNDKEMLFFDKIYKDHDEGHY